MLRREDSCREDSATAAIALLATEQNQGDSESPYYSRLFAVQYLPQRCLPRSPLNRSSLVADGKILLTGQLETFSPTR